MNIETQIQLDRFKPREYQKPIIDALWNKGYKRVLAIWPRRAGKDILAFQVCIRMAMRKVQTIFYVFPTFASGRRILWDAITNDGFRVLDYCPEEIATRNEQQMRLKFNNGSVIQIIGSNDFDQSLVGTNPQFIVFSEYSLQDPRAYQFARPILTANNGSALFLSTPRGHNHLWDLYEIARNHPKEWFVSKLTVDDTKHIDYESIKREIESGEISESFAKQEYWTSFDEGQDGFFYATIIDKMKLNNQIGNVPYEPGFPVITAWDLGINDPTVIVFAQLIGKSVHIFDYYSASGRDIGHFARYVLDKPYRYLKHFPPHDIMATEQGTGLTRREMYKQLGLNFSESYNIGILDGIELVKAKLPTMWIDETKCKDLIKHLQNYSQEWDSARGRYREIAKHDQHSHAADAMRYLCVALKRATFTGTTPEELDKRYREAVYGDTLPNVFNDNNYYQGY